VGGAVSASVQVGQPAGCSRGASQQAHALSCHLKQCRDTTRSSLPPSIPPALPITHPHGLVLNLTDALLAQPIGNRHLLQQAGGQAGEPVSQALHAAPQARRRAAAV
jgi:hypothetical protein